jgi:alkanesulfonate monooxygenase SsuD/methylene tetrahydromethanopterin reductase-like flavin-dependent oxidoreductase (luciferase family)
MTVRFGLRYDLRVPNGSPWSHADLYQRMLRQVEQAERVGFELVMLSEHHGDDWGYLPTPVTIGAAIASRCPTLTISLCLIVLPLHHPLEVADQLAVLDNLTNGRVEVCVGAGYRRTEYTARGIPYSERFGRLEEHLTALKIALRCERFSYSSRYLNIEDGFVQPATIQRPIPVTLGGGTIIAARRAARLADGFVPNGFDPDVIAAYRNECERLDKPAGIVRKLALPLNVHVCSDPDSRWQDILQSLCSADAARFAAWSRGDERPVVEDIPRGAGYFAFTGAEVRERVQRAIASGSDVDVMLAPLLPGLDPDLADESLQSFIDSVHDLVEVRAL